MFEPKSHFKHLEIIFALIDEDLIKWGWPEDVWFHVDKVSSAHVYLRLGPGQSLEDVPVAVIEDAAQLVKANSITGTGNVTIFNDPLEQKSTLSQSPL